MPRAAPVQAPSPHAPCRVAPRPGRPVLPLLALALLGGCDPAGLGAGAAVTAGSVAVAGRTPVDALVSLATGRDCSVVRLDRRLPYCAPPMQPAGIVEPFCTRSLGRVDCWTRPPLAIPPTAGVADRPALPASRPPSPAVAEPVAAPISPTP